MRNVEEVASSKQGAEGIRFSNFDLAKGVHVCS